MSESLTKSIHAIRLKGLTVVKTGKISGGINAMFASYPDVWAALHPELCEHNLSVGFTSSRLEPFGPDGAEKVSMDLHISNGDAMEFYSFEMLVPEKILNSRGSSVTNNAQRVANAQSYLKRTSLILFFGMSAGNEDEVERMMPAGDQTNIPGIIRVTDTTNWQDLTDGLWRDVESPLHDGTLKAYEEPAAMVGLWDQFPNHPGITAWAADYVTGGLQFLKKGWADVAAMDPTLPETIQACDGPAMRLATKAIKALKKEGGK